MATANLNQPTSAANGNIPYTGATANDDSGNTIRDSFNRINDRIKEIYGAQDGSNVVQTPFVDGDNIKDDIITESHLDVTNSPVDGYVLTYDSASSGFTWEQKFDGDITGIVAGLGLTGSSLDSGDATLNVNVDDSTIEIDTDTVRLKDNGVTHAKLEDRYTTTATAVTTSGATTIDWSTAASFPITMGGAHTLNFSNYKKGQVVDLIISGAYAVTLGTTSGTPVFNKVGTQSYDTTTTNIIQVMCTDDDSTPNFFFAIGTYAVAQPQ